MRKRGLDQPSKLLPIVLQSWADGQSTSRVVNSLRPFICRTKYNGPRWPVTVAPQRASIHVCQSTRVHGGDESEPQRARGQIPQSVQRDRFIAVKFPIYLVAISHLTNVRPSDRSTITIRYPVSLSNTCTTPDIASPAARWGVLVHLLIDAATKYRESTGVQSTGLWITIFPSADTASTAPPIPGSSADDKLPTKPGYGLYTSTTSETRQHPYWKICFPT